MAERVTQITRDLTQIRENARHMSDDEWQAFTYREAAKAIAAWFEAKGRLERPIHRLTMRDLEAIADQAITRWIVLASSRLRAAPEKSEDLTWLMGA